MERSRDRITEPDQPHWLIVPVLEGVSTACALLLEAGVLVMPTQAAERPGMHSHVERGNERILGQTLRTLVSGTEESPHYAYHIRNELLRR